MERSREFKNQDFVRYRKIFKLGPVFSALSFMGMLPFTKTGMYSKRLALRYFYFLVFMSLLLVSLSSFALYLVSNSEGLGGISLIFMTTDLMRVILRLGALWAVYWAARHHKDEFRILWVSLAGVKLFSIYRTKTIVSCVVLLIHFSRWLVLQYFVFDNDVSEINNNIFEAVMTLVSFLMTLLTLFYCAVLKFHKDKCHYFKMYVKRKRSPFCCDQFFATLNNMATVNCLSGYHTLFLVAGAILEYMQGGYLFMRIAYAPSRIDLIDGYKIFFHAVHLFSVLHLMYIQVLECSLIPIKVIF